MLDRLSYLMLSIFSYMIFGYLAGLIIGLTAFDPNSDIYALLSLVLAIIGIVVGLIPFFQRRAHIVFGAVVGFYVGMLLSILIWGKPATDGLLDVLQRGGLAFVVAVVIAILGGVVSSRVDSSSLKLPALVLLLGGFLGGALFSLAGIPSTSMLGIAPYVLGSGIALSLLVWWLQKGLTHKPIQPQGQ